MRRTHARHQPFSYPPTPPIRPPAIDRFLNMLVWIIVIGLGLFVAYLLAVPPAPLALPTSAPAMRPAPPAAVDPGQATYDAAAPAALPQAQPAAAQPAAVNNPATWPTAGILVATIPPADQITIVPLAAPLVVAPGSDMRPTPVTVMPYPTPLPAAIADNFEVSADGKCITAPRNGVRYQVCQDWEYAPQEIATVADLIRGGTLPGVEVVR